MFLMFCQSRKSACTRTLKSKIANSPPLARGSRQEVDSRNRMVDKYASLYLGHENGRPEHRLQDFDHGGPLGDVEDVRGGQREVVLVQVEAKGGEQPAVNSNYSKYRTVNTEKPAVNIELRALKSLNFCEYRSKNSKIIKSSIYLVRGRCMLTGLALTE